MARHGCCEGIRQNKVILLGFDRGTVSWENKPTRVGGIMQTLATEIDQMIVQLNQYILPSSLMESFDVYREECVREAAQS